MSDRSAHSVSQSLVANVVDEFTQRLNRGDAPDIEQYVQRHPEIAEPLRRVLGSLMLLRQPQVQSSEATTGHPRQLGDFRIIGELGRGGMGIVYEAEQITLLRRVAVKVFPFAGLLDDRQLQRFKNEARAAAMLKHPNIVSVLSVGQERGVQYYAMELVEGQSLAEFIHATSQEAGKTKRGTARETGAAGKDTPSAHETTRITSLATEYSHDRRAFDQRVARLGIKIADALQYAHEQGVVHRDIKPSNILLNTAGEPQVTDFGLARIEGAGDVTMTGDLVGTLRYMSPEQLDGRRVVDARTDIYGLGVTLYELIAGKPAFASSSRPDLMRDIVAASPTPLRKLAPKLPPDLETIVAKAMAATPDARYESARELREDLQRFLAGKSVRARRVGTLTIAAKWCLRNRAKAALLGLVTLMLLAFAIGGPLAARQQARLAEKRHRELYANEMKSAYDSFLNGEHEAAARVLDKYGPGKAGEHLRGFEWYYLWKETRRRIEAPVVRSGGFTVHCLARSPNGDRIACGVWTGLVRCFDASTLTTVWDSSTNPRRHGNICSAAAFSEDGKSLFTCGRDGTLKFWNAESGQLHQTVSLPISGNAIAVSRQGIDHQ